jgi:hypothetical protein
MVSEPFVKGSTLDYQRTSRVDTVDKPADFEELDGGVIDVHKRRRKPTTAQQGGGAVYGLGLIGALVWFCRQANEPGEYAVGVLKALVWPALLVYEAFKALHGLAEES